jgi:hypothetical protein
MRKPALIALVGVLLAVSCGRNEQDVVQLPDVQRSDVANAVLEKSDLGAEWTQEANPAPNTVQIGGRVGAANVRPFRAEETSAFRRTEPGAFVSNSVYLLRNEEMTRAVIAAHEDAARRGSWTQERDDGGRTTFTYEGSVKGLSALGDAVFAARLKASLTDASGKTTESAIEYVTYSVGPLVAFVIAESVAAATFASRQEAKVARLLTR